ncbi:DUF6624 domain-containing protein [Robertkochia aurantiaca]|uniref:DUF6624 domain-containing protein n=1 Tax=Robertkochia aurantiaca TaxID=2873700 RepID=UPI001CCFE0DE|nr:DUF6624 domain-containing protein [Robertkochia sp. 3YJGBD-33]
MFVLLTFSMNAQSVNDSLKLELESILKRDQAVRELMNPSITDERKNELLALIGYSEKEFTSNPWGISVKQDSINQQQVFEILDTYGYPGKSMVGEPANRAAWYVVQHSESIEKYLPLIREAGEKGELPMRYVAQMEDRYLMDQGKEQLYGTQVWGAKPKGKEEQVFVIWPIKDPDKVNERRRQAGFNGTIEEYASRMDMEYRVYTLEEMEEMFKPENLPGNQL